MGDSRKIKLRLITYLAPSIPIAVFEMIRDYIEEKVSVETLLIYESRWSGPPSDRDPDPFTADEVDIGFLCTSAFQRFLEEKNPYIELCEAAPVYSHPHNNTNSPIFFSDVIIHKDNSVKYEQFSDLKGHKWAYNDPVSLSGNLMALAELKKMGYNSNFFGHIIQSGSNLNSIDMVLEKKVDAASVDSTSLQTAMRKSPELRKSISILTSLGPMPVQPVIFNKRLPVHLKKAITDALLSMHKDVVWKQKLGNHCMERYVPVDISFYDMEKHLREVVKGLSVNTAYY